MEGSDSCSLLASVVSLSSFCLSSCSLLTYLLVFLLLCLQIIPDPENKLKYFEKKNPWKCHAPEWLSLKCICLKLLSTGKNSFASHTFFFCFYLASSLFFLSSYALLFWGCHEFSSCAQHCIMKFSCWFCPSKAWTTCTDFEICWAILTYANHWDI